MRRVVVIVVAITTGVISWAAWSRNAMWLEWRKRLLWAWAVVPSGPVGRLSSRVMPWGHGQLYRLMAAALELAPEDDLLEVACGSGPFLARYASHVRHVAGLDLSEPQVALARRRLADRIAAGTAEIVHGDAGTLPWGDGSFSAVVCNSTEAFPEPGQALSEMYRVLRPGGRAVVLMGSRVAEGTEPHVDRDWDVWVWTEADARRLMEDAGFSDLSVSYHDIIGGGGLRFVRGTRPPSSAIGDAPASAPPALAGASAG